MELPRIKKLQKLPNAPLRYFYERRSYNEQTHESGRIRERYSWFCSSDPGRQKATRRERKKENGGRLQDQTDTLKDVPFSFPLFYIYLYRPIVISSLTFSFCFRVFLWDLITCFQSLCPKPVGFLSRVKLFLSYFLFLFLLIYFIIYLLCHYRFPWVI